MLLCSQRRTGTRLDRALCQQWTRSGFRLSVYGATSPNLKSQLTPMNAWAAQPLVGDRSPRALTGDQL